MDIAAEFLAQVVTGENQRASRVFFLAEAIKVGGETDLGFDLLLAVAEIVVRDERDDHTGLVTTSQLEGPAVVIKFGRVAPAHLVTALAVVGEIPVGQAGGLLGHRYQMGSEDDAARMAGPMVHVQSGVILREAGVAGVAENAFDEVQVAD
jgi:hypothetical protein